MKCEGQVYLQSTKPLTFAEIGILPDFASLTETDTDQGHSISGIGFGNSRFVSCRAYYIKYSTDYGATWTEAMAGGTLYKLWKGVAYSASLGLWVAVGSTGELWTSANDGVDWTTRTSSFSSTDILAVAWSPAISKFVASGASGKIAVSSNGVDWTQKTPPSGVAGNLRGIASSSTTIVICDETNGSICYSDDGETWLQANAGTRDVAGTLRVTYLDGCGLFVATTKTGVLITSRDGRGWAYLAPQNTSGSVAAATHIYAIGTDGTRALMIARGGMAFIFDGMNIFPAYPYLALTTDYSLGGVAYGGGIWCVGGASTNKAAYYGSSYNIATSFRLPKPGLDAGIYSDSWIKGD